MRDIKTSAAQMEATDRYMRARKERGDRRLNLFLTADLAARLEGVALDAGIIHAKGPAAGQPNINETIQKLLVKALDAGLTPDS